jgi:hypothetical protein
VNGPGPGVRAALGHGTVLCLMMMLMLMLMMMVMMVSRSGERRAGKYQEQEGCCKNFLHGLILRRLPRN